MAPADSLPGDVSHEDCEEKWEVSAQRVLPWFHRSRETASCLASKELCWSAMLDAALLALVIAQGEPRLLAMRFMSWPFFSPQVNDGKNVHRRKVSVRTPRRVPLAPLDRWMLEKLIWKCIHVKVMWNSCRINVEFM